MKYTQLAINDSDDLLFGTAPRPLLTRRGMSIGGGLVYPELNFTLPPMEVTAATMPAVTGHYRDIIEGALRRAAELQAPGVVIEFETVPPMTTTPAIGMEIAQILLDAMEAAHRQHGLKSVLRMTPNDNREFSRPPVMRSGEHWERMLELFELSAAAGAELLSIESVGGKELHDEALMQCDLGQVIFSLCVLGARDMAFLWKTLGGIARKHSVVCAGDTACGFGNTAMVLAEQKMIPRVFAAVVRAVTAVRTLVGYEHGLIGPGKDCGYENPYLKAITGYPMSMEGKTSACAHLSPLGNIAAAYADLWSNESVQDVRLLGGPAPTVYLEQLIYDCRLMNRALAEGRASALTLRRWLVDSDARLDPQAWVLTPENVIGIARAIVAEPTPYRAGVAAARTAIAALRSGLASGLLQIPRREVSFLDSMSRQLDELPDDEGDFIEQQMAIADPAKYLPAEYEISSMGRLTLSPAGVTLPLTEGTPLVEALFAQGVEFPCGGRGRCKGCRVKVLEGALPVLEPERQLLAPAELDAGWRLACLHRISGDLRLELAQWEMPVLGDASPFPFQPGTGLGVAVDLGTTTLVAQLVDLRSGEVLAVQSALNAQARFGADVMSRLEYAGRHGQAELEGLIRAQVGGQVAALLAQAPGPLSRVVIVGNTAMHHLFCGVPIAPLARHPFRPARLGRIRFDGRELGWTAAPEAPVAFLPCIGGFVGADVLAGIIATGMHERAELTALVDLGTNGEIVVGNRDRLLATSTAAGPAFEGARISHGMRAATGAISAVTVADGALACRVIGGGPARGLCGSGLVDAIAAGLELGRIDPGGRLPAPGLALQDGVMLIPPDVREFQLAKGAIAAGLGLLTERLGASLGELGRVHLAGAFGNYVGAAGACRVGLLPVRPDQIAPAGNTALLGAKLALFQDPELWDRVGRFVEHVALNEDPDFQDAYMDAMGFPPEAGRP